MIRLAALFFVTFCGFLRPSNVIAAAADNPATRVIILANAADPDSLRLARYYAEKRSVPVENIISLRMPVTETITWPEFISTLWQPLQDELLRLKWIDAVTLGTLDDTGRRNRAPHGHNISYLVVCRGVPLRISNSPEFFRERPPVTARPEMRTNQSSVDSDLALIAQGTPPINALVDNPLYNNESPTALQGDLVVKVSRLDGPAVADAFALVDRALEAERTGLAGRAYFDLRSNGSDADRLLEKAAAEIGSQFFPAEIDRSPETIPSRARFDAPVFYFGWYAGNVNGPFSLPGFQFPAGAVALHIHSYSAQTLRSTTDGWAGPFVARGATATVGNVHEPYLEFTHDPSLLARALARGWNFGDAAAYAVPALSWQAVAIGDPLYRPLARPLAAQLADRGRLSDAAAGYVVLREVERLERAGAAEPALALLRSAAAERPTLALGLALSERLLRRGDREGAARALGSLASKREFAADEWALAFTAGKQLRAAGDPAGAILYARTLLADPTLPPDLRAAWTEETQTWER